MSTPRPPAYRPQARLARPTRTRAGLATTSLVLGILSFLTCSFLGVGAITGLVLGIVALVKASRQPDVYGGRGMAIAGVVLSGISVLTIPIAAAIAIPSLLRARVSANEAAAIGDARTVTSAQAAYAASNGGFADGRLECLVTPASCIPGYPATAPHFLDASIATSEPRLGYRRRLLAGPPASPSLEQRSQVSPSSVQAYAFLLEPVTPGQTGVRAFCADSSGIVCSTRDGGTPATTPEGSCDTSRCMLVR